MLFLPPHTARPNRAFIHLRVGVDPLKDHHYSRTGVPPCLNLFFVPRVLSFFFSNFLSECQPANAIRPVDRASAPLLHRATTEEGVQMHVEEINNYWQGTYLSTALIRPPFPCHKQHCSNPGEGCLHLFLFPPPPPPPPHTPPSMNCNKILKNKTPPTPAFPPHPPPACLPRCSPFDAPCVFLPPPPPRTLFSHNFSSPPPHRNAAAMCVLRTPSCCRGLIPPTPPHLTTTTPNTTKQCGGRCPARCWPS